MIRIKTLCIFILLEVASVVGQSVEWTGQASGWLQFSKDQKKNATQGLRYIPELKGSLSVTNQSLFDLELSLNIFGTHRVRSAAQPAHYSAIKPYRMWLRYSGRQFEFRLGLQKINFGPARILRSLRWFDRVDPRDPLQLTDGIYGFLARYYFLNNANVWLWGLSGNEEEKGMEFLATEKNTVELGGRLQYPVPRGEVGFTFHQRKAREPLQNGQWHSTPERRLAVDGSWDLGVALWLEAVLIKNDYIALRRPWQKNITLGGDYTFDWGNGFHVTAEHLIFTQSEKAGQWQNRFDFSALMLDYPLNIMDRLNYVAFYHYGEKQWYHYGGWQRTYDNWMINLSAFWNPAKTPLFEKRQTLLGGKGVQLMVVFNH